MVDNIYKVLTKLFEKAFWMLLKWLQYHFYGVKLAQRVCKKGKSHLDWKWTKFVFFKLSFDTIESWHKNKVNEIENRVFCLRFENL